MASQNIFEAFTDDPVKFHMQSLKTKLLMVVINLIRQKGWTQATAAKELNVSQPRMSNLFKGQLSKFSIDTLLEMLVRLGYKPDSDFNPTNESTPLIVTLKKAML